MMCVQWVTAGSASVQDLRGHNGPCVSMMHCDTPGVIIGCINRGIRFLAREVMIYCRRFDHHRLCVSGLCSSECALKRVTGQLKRETSLVVWGRGCEPVASLAQADSQTRPFI